MNYFSVKSGVVPKGLSLERGKKKEERGKTIYVQPLSPIQHTHQKTTKELVAATHP